MSTDTEDEVVDIDPEREELVRGLTDDELSALTDEQIQAVTNIAAKRSEDKPRERVRAALKNEAQAILSGLTSPPFTYTSPEIRIAAGFTVRFTTIVHAQLRDAYAGLDEFVRTERPNEIRVGDFLNRQLVAHALSQVNGADFGDVNFDAGAFRDLQRSNANEADKMLKATRTKRLQALDELSPHIVERLVKFYYAFQNAVEAVANDDGVMGELGN